MRLVAITSFPPGTKPLNSFGYHAVRNFTKIAAVDRISVIGDVVPNKPLFEEIMVGHKCVEIFRRWKFNSISAPISVIKMVMALKPDLVWLNLQYTMFAVKPIPAYLGLFIPIVLKVLGYPVVIVLHNYLGAVDLKTMGLGVIKLPAPVFRLADTLALSSICGADGVFVMRSEYQEDLSRRFPQSHVLLMEQDLFEAVDFLPVNSDTKEILTIGYFGTYKKLQFLLEAFLIVQKLDPATHLLIAGQSSMHTPDYMDSIYKNHQGNKGIDFLGYVPEDQVKTLFQHSNLVIITNSTSTGDSGVVRMANLYGRPLLVPEEFARNLKRKSGILSYNTNNPQDLVRLIIELLHNPAWQNELGLCGFREASSSGNSFLISHQKAFLEAAPGDKYASPIDKGTN